MEVFLDCVGAYSTDMHVPILDTLFESLLSNEGIQLKEAQHSNLSKFLIDLRNRRTWMC
jgi:hypothetical protein